MNYFKQFLDKRKLTIADFERAGSYTPRFLQGTEDFCVFLHSLPKDYPIGFITDYDTDGMMAGFISYIGSRLCGFTNVRLCRRDTSAGYLFRPEDVDSLGFTDNAGVIITGDVGISCYKALQYAKDKGFTVAVTDHHRPGKGILPADFIINWILDGDFQKDNTECCGAYTIFQLFECYARMYPDEVSNLGDLMLLRHFAGIATVADNMPLLGRNRHLVKDAVRFFNYVAPLNGSLDIADHMCCDGVFQNALTNFCLFINILREDYPAKFSYDFIGWTLAPAINSIKRMEADGGLLYQILFSANVDEFCVYLKELNQRRRELVNEEFDRIFVEGESQMFPDLCYMTQLNPGMMGLLSAKITEATGMPAFTIGERPVKSSGGGYAYGGSVRSPEWYPFFSRVNQSGLALCSGHEHSCAISIPAKNLYDLYTFLHLDIEMHRPAVQPVVFANIEDMYDVVVDCNENLYGFPDDIREFMRYLSYWGPFGPGMEPPLVLLKLSMDHIRVEGLKDETHTKVWFADRMCALLWNMDPGAVYFSSKDGVLYLQGHFKYAIQNEELCINFEGSPVFAFDMERGDWA